MYGHGSISKWAVVAYRAADTMIWTGTCKTVGMKFYLELDTIYIGIQGGGLHINLFVFNFNDEAETPPHTASTHGAPLLHRLKG